ncbi:hypothetical protein MKEN_00112900 [Mycena kentingensis (nom. inval.)]|nr:hypothetical protein MKEN_00112900 [Mycena kentingensis (nom. inval.)]
MVEPALLTTFRLPLLAARAMSRPIRIHLSSDFFVPRPRCAKGKEREDTTILSIHTARCQDWSCRMRVSRYATNPETVRKRTPRGPRRARANSPPRGISFVHRGQTRHASQSSDRNPPDPPEPPIVPDPPPETTSSLESSDCATDDPGNVPDPPPPVPSDTDEILLPELTLSPAEALVHLRQFVRSPFPLGKLSAALEVDGCLTEMSEDEVLDFAESLVDSVELLEDLGEVHAWGERVGRVLNTVTASEPSQRVHNLNARAVALSGDLQRALDLAKTHRPEYADFGPFLRVYESILVLTWRHFDRISALEFLAFEWKTLGSYLLTETSRIHSGTPSLVTASRSLRQAAYAIVSAISDPAAVLSERRNDWDPQQLQHIGDVLLEALIRADNPLQASEIVEQMQRQDLTPAPHLVLLLIRSLAREEYFAQAHHFYASLKPERKFGYLFTGLYINAKEGRDEETVDYFNRISERGWINPKVIVELMYAYAVKGRTAETLQVFQEFYPEDEDGMPTNKPRIEHFNVGLFAHAVSGDFAGTKHWLSLMRKVGIQPDAYCFSTILKTFAMRGDLESISNVLDQMRAARCNPNRVTYTNVMTLLAHRKDPTSTEAIYSRAIREGVIPDTKMVNTVMNAHIESGSWSGVIRAFDFIRSSPHARIGIDTYNILLKAYVQIGSPFHIVARIFAQLEKLRLRPDEYSFALLIQSACDGRAMSAAANIFKEMERLAEHWDSTRHITTWSMTIIMAGFLRIGNNEQAMSIYADMEKRGLKPNHITYGTVMRSYGREGSEESFQLAEEFVKNVVSQPASQRTWEEPNYGRVTSRSRLYIPLMRSYIKRGKPEEVNRLFNEVLQDGGEPTLSMLHTLLESYVAMRDIRSVLALWPQIFDLGVRYSNVSVLEDRRDDAELAKMHTFVLCTPLDLYLKALSAEGMHDEIAKVWKQFQDEGFSFSSENWNELALALLNAGELERCFEVLERVIIPYYRQSQRARRQRINKPTSPLTLVDTSPDSDWVPRPFDAPRSSRQRREAAKWHRYHQRAVHELDSEEHGDDLAYQLHVIHQISPMWNSWQTRHDVLSTMFRATLKLRAGYPVDAEDEEAVGDESHLETFTIRERREAANARLQNLLEQYPETVTELGWFERKEQKRLGRHYRTVYRWADDMRRKQRV